MPPNKQMLQCLKSAQQIYYNIQHAKQKASHFMLKIIITMKHTHRLSPLSKQRLDMCYPKRSFYQVPKKVKKFPLPTVA